MQQNTNQYARYLSIAFGIILISAIIMYFFPQPGDVKWLTLNKALEQSVTQNKPVLLYPYQKLASKNKIANKAIYSNDTVVKFIYDNFIPAGINLDNKADAESAKSKYLVGNGNYSIVLDKYGRGIAFLDNSWSAGVFREFAKELLKYNYFKFDDFEVAKSNAVITGKKLLVFVTNNYFQNISINEKLKNEKLMTYINEKFIPSAMMTYVKGDLELIKLYFDEEETLRIDFSMNTGTGINQFTTDPASTVLVINSDDSLMGKIELEQDTDLKKELEKILNKKE
ncbi:MAG: hypothetical protein RO257_03020 [Candidatus Kapabacteria bacterium]|nr:hypothetical protein [Candidatus Kapabacteria bacterium]